jgi:hypothetical protein
LYQRILFASHEPASSEAEVNGLLYERPPAIDDDPATYDLVSFDCAVGDCIVFDMRTLQGSLAQTSPKATARRFTLRMTAPDGRIRYRGDWAKTERAIFEAAGYSDGDAIRGDFFPQLWPRA